MTSDPKILPFENYLKNTASEINAALESALGNACLKDERARPPQLMQAMRHGVLNGGKRLRPFLVIQSAALFGISQSQAMQTACALECLHCYSLIHDDLPAMDDDDLRRGQPTVHKAFDEATAILAGDALLTLAFDMVADEAAHSNPTVRIKLVQSLSRAAGIGGMIGGQMLDIEAEKFPPDEAGIRLLQSMKTGALIRFACQAGALLGEAENNDLEKLTRFGEIIGLAFQLVDDLLDVTSTTEEMGKATGKDAASGKGTLVSMLGQEKVRSILEELSDEADTILKDFGQKAATLRQASRFIIERSH